MRRLLGRGLLVVWLAAILACGTSGSDEASEGELDDQLADLEERVAEADDEVTAGNVVDVSTDDPELRAAEAQARATLDDFIADLNDPPPGHSGHAIKTAFRDGEATEHMWVGQLAWDGERFTGVLDNDPVDVHNVRMGQRVTVERAEVEDWIYDDGETMVGGYTVRVLMGRQTR